jgi:hypothetical protein
MLMAFPANGSTFVALWIRLPPLAGWRLDRSACLADGFGITELLFAQFKWFRWFEASTNLEDRNDAIMTSSRHLGAWRCVDNLRVQLTRAWSAARKD